VRAWSSTFCRESLAQLGGWVAYLLGFAGVTRLNLYGILVASCGAILLFFIYHAIRRNVIGRRIL